MESIRCAHEPDFDSQVLVSNSICAVLRRIMFLISPPDALGLVASLVFLSLSRLMCLDGPRGESTCPSAGAQSPRMSSEDSDLPRLPEPVDPLDVFRPVELSRPLPPFSRIPPPRASPLNPGAITVRISPPASAYSRCPSRLIGC